MSRLRTNRIMGCLLTAGLVLLPFRFVNAEQEGHTQGQAHEETFHWKDINWIHWGDMQRPPLAFVLANFVLFVLVLRRTLFRTARQMTEERHTQIKLALEQAQRDLKEAEQALQQATNQMEQVQVVRAEWVLQAQHEVSLERAHMQRETEMVVQAFQKDLERRLQLERSRLASELQSRVLTQSVEQARQWLLVRFGAEDQQKQVAQILASVEALAEPRRPA